MPLSPQIVITPEDIVYKSFNISAVTYTSSTATYTVVGHTLSAGDIVMITGIAPDGYNGTYTISSVATNTFTISNTTNTALTDQVGNAYWADPTDYEYDGGQTVAYIPNDDDVNDIVDTNATVAAAVAEAEAAAIEAAAAQADATTALANAATAYNAAIGSLQPSASTIVNASNQMTAISTNGITVYSGSSASSGARVVLNSTGLAGFNSGGIATFSISASTGAAVFSGSVTGSTITGGTLNIGGNAIINASGLLTATGATITGDIRATAGYFGTASNGFSINSTGLVGVGSGVISGGAISGTSITTNSGTIAGWTLTSTSFTNAGADTFLFANPGTDGVAYSTIGRGIMRRLQLNGSSGTTLGSNVLAVGGSAAVDGALSVIGNLTVSSYIYNPGYQVSTSGGAARINDASTPTARLVAASGSSIRFKKDIVDISTVSALDPKLLLQVPVKAFKYREDYLDAEDERSDVLVPGFIAEELDAIYPVAVDHDAQGRASRWSSDFIVPGLLALVQQQEARIQKLEGEVNGN